MDEQTLQRAQHAVRNMSDRELLAHSRNGPAVIVAEAWTAIQEEVDRRGLGTGAGRPSAVSSARPLNPHQRQAAPPQSSQPRTSLPRCPTCGSDDVRSFRVLFESGTSTFAGSTTTQGMGFDGGYGVAVSNTAGQQQSVIASSAAPPPAPGQGAGNKLGCALLAAVLPSFWVLTHLFPGPDDSPPPSDTAWVGWVLVLLAVVAIALVYDVVQQYNRDRETYPERLAAWERSWRCMRCGAAFESKKT